MHGFFNIPAAMIILILTAILARGTKESSLFNNVIVAIKVAVVLAVIIFGASSVVPRQLDAAGAGKHRGVWPFRLERRDPRRGRSCSSPISASMRFRTAAQEARLPQRDVPIGILGSLIICTILYIAVAAVATGIVPYQQLGVPDRSPWRWITPNCSSWISWAVRIGRAGGAHYSDAGAIVWTDARVLRRWRGMASFRQYSQNCIRIGERPRSARHWSACSRL